LQASDDAATLIVGRSGRLARAFAFMLRRARVVGQDVLDITSLETVMRVLAEIRPTLVLNCAAITDMKRCEANPAAAWAVNVEGVRHLAEGCHVVGATLVHFSSDYALDPVNEYARTKRASEGFADLTVRAKIYDASHWAWLALRQGQSVRMTTHEYCNPITTTGIVLTTAALLSRGRRGVVSCGTAERLTFWQVGRIWAGVLGVSPQLVEPIGPVDSTLPRLAEMFLPTEGMRECAIEVPTIEIDATRHLEAYSRYGTSC
jgi:dTDP-4-dehydrorhamnose reductase